MMKYEIVAAIDFSGAESVAAQKKHIFLAIIRIKNLGVEIISDISRDECRERIQALLHRAHNENEYCLIGFDFSFWFPAGFFQRVYKMRMNSWREQLRILTEGTNKIPPLGDKPRIWAAQKNEIFKQEYHVSGGPFWGPGFSQKTKPVFPYDALGFLPRRLIEERFPKMKSVFQIGGVGSVGLQALAGMGQIGKLLSFCREQHIPLHVWPFDGWQPAAKNHLFCEIYPGLYNHGPKGDLEDALASAHWFVGHMNENTLAQQFRPQLNAAESRRAQTEGWVPGVG